MRFWWAKLIIAITAGTLVGLSVPTTTWWLAFLAAFGTAFAISLIMDGLRWSYSKERERHESHR